MGTTKSKPERRIVLLGKTGDGKSSTGNTILRKYVFPTTASPNSLTDKSLKGDRMIGGRKITVIDTPGYYTSQNKDTMKCEIIRSLIEYAPGPYTFIIVLKVGKYSVQEMEIVDKIVQYCGNDVFKQSVVLFTHGEQLEGQTIEEFVKKSPKLQELVSTCGGRCHVIDNKYWKKSTKRYKSNKVQVKNLLNTIKKMEKENGSYTNKLLQTVEQQIQDEMRNLEKDNLSQEEKREKAKKIVHEKLLDKLKDETPDTLIGALLGIGHAVFSDLKLLKPDSIPPVMKAIEPVAQAAAKGLKLLQNFF